jgi:hypothetical protein
MRLNRIFQHELSEVFQQSSLVGSGLFTGQGLSDMTRSEHKAVQNLYAKALRRAVRRARSGGGRGRATS